MALAQHRALAVLARRRPRLPLPELAGLAPFLGDRDEQFQRRLGVGHNAEIGIEDAPDLRRLDIDVHEGPPLGVGLDRTGVPVGPAVADPRSEEHTSELQSHSDLVCRLLLEKKKKKRNNQVNIKKKKKK